MPDEQPKLTRAEIAAKAGAATFRLTDEKLDKLVEYVRIGNYAKVAAAAVGINEASYYRWIKRGAEVLVALDAELGDEADIEAFIESYDNAVAVLPGLHENDWMCSKLCVSINKANAEAEVYAVGIVRKHMPDQWTAAMTFLERKAPDRWKRREQLDVAAQGAGTELSDEDKALLEPEAQKHLGQALKAAAQHQLEAGEQQS